MSLERRIAFWVDLGVVDYQKAHELQEMIVPLRRNGSVPDIILSLQHPPIVSFGNDKNNNRFSERFLAEAEGYDIKELLGEKGIAFSQTNRSGGAAVFAPGQLVYLPIVDHTRITGKEMDIAEYKSRIYNILFVSLEGLGVEGIKVGSQELYQTRRERKDVWKQRDGTPLKMGSKGLRYSGSVVYGGFALFIDKEGNEYSWIVDTCGYSPDEAIVWSLEEELGRRFQHEEVHKVVKREIKDQFGYDDIKDITPQEFYSTLEVRSYA